MENFRSTNHSRAAFSGFAVHRAFFVALTFAALTFFATNQVHAAGTTVSWTGNAGTGNWATTNNWGTGFLGTLTDLSPTFGGSNQLVTTNSTFSTLARITFSATAGAFVLNGSGLGATVAVSDRIENLSTNIQTINFDISYTAVEEVNVYSNTGTTILNGVISGAGGMLVSDRATAATAGTLALNGSNTFTGAVTVTFGTLRIANSAALGATNSGTTITAGATLALTTNSLGEGITVAEVITNSGTGVGSLGAIRNLAGTNAITGRLVLANAARINSDAGLLVLSNASGTAAISGTADALTFGGAGDTLVATTISNTTGTLTKDGTGLLTLAASNAYTNTTTVAAGVLRAANAFALGANASSLVVSNNAALELSNNISIGAKNLSIAGSGIGGTGALRNVHGTNTYGGAITVTNATTFEADADTQLTLGSTVTGGFDKIFDGAGNIIAGGVISGAAGLTKTGTGTLTLNAANSYTGLTAINGGSLVFGVANALSNGAVTINSNAVLNIGSFSDTNGAVTLTDGSIIGTTGVLTGTSYTVQNGSISAILGGASSALSKTGAGTVVLSGANTYSGATTIGGGTLSVSADNNLGTAPGAATAGRLTFTNGGTLAVTTGFTLSSNRGIALGTGGGVFDIAAGQALSYGGIITGANTLTKNGAGTLTLSGASSYANTTLNAGTLNINNGNALGNSVGTLTLGNGVAIDNTSGSAITVLNPKSISLGSSLNFLGSNSLNLGDGSVTFTTNTTIDVAANTLRFDGDVTGSGLGLTKTGAGTLEFHGLSGSNSYTGNTLISNGRLLLSGTSIFGGTTNTTVTVSSNAFLEIGTSASVGNVTVVSRPDGWINNATNVITADIVYDQSGTLSANNANYNGTTTIESGVTISTAADYFGTVPTNAVADRIVLQNNATLQATASFDIEANQGVQLASGTATIASEADVALFVNSAVSGSGELLKTGSGNIRLLGTNTYTGGTVIEQGIVGIVADTSLGDVTGRLKLSGGSVVAAQTITGPTNSGTTIDASRTVVLGNGTTSGLQAQTGLSLTYNGVIAEEGAGAAANVFVGTAGPRAGTVSLGGLNTYQGSTTLSAGVLEVANIANGGQASGLGQSGSAASNLVLNGGTLRFTGTSASTDRLFTIGGPAVTLDTGTGSLAFTNSGSLLISSTNSSHQIILSGSGSGELAAAIGDAGVGSTTALTKSGAGAWTLSGFGTFTGGTFLNEGTLRLASASAAGGGSIAQSSGLSTLVVDTGGTVTNQMSVYNVTTLQTVTLSGNKTLNNATYNVTNNTTTTESGTLTGDGGITKLGTGTLLVTGDNSFTGGLDVQEGLLNLSSSTGSAAALTTSVSVSGGATLLISQNDQVNNSATVSLSGGTIRTAAGVSEVFGDLTVGTASFLDFGTTSYANANTISFGTYTPSALLTINNFDFGSTLTFKSDLTSTINNSSFFTFTNGGIASSSWDEGSGTFTITAIPEPSTYLAAAGLLALMLWPSRRRLLKDAKSILGLRAPMRDRLAAHKA